MAARADCDRTLARSYGHFDALLVGTEVGLLVEKPRKRWQRFKIVISSMARTGAVGETSTINPSRTRFASQSQQAVAYLGRSHRMMNEIPTKTRTGERTEPFLMVGQKKSRVDSGSGNLPSLRRPERTNQPPELVRRVAKSLGIFKMRGHA